MGRIYKVAKMRVSIGAASDDDMTLAKFKADTTYVSIDGLTNIGGFGRTKQLITSDHVNSGITKKAPGTTNFGSMALTMDRQPKDLGQLALLAASASDDPFNIKVETPVGKNKWEVDYFTAYVLASSKEFGGSNDTQKLQATLEIDSEPLNEQPA